VAQSSDNKGNGKPRPASSEDTPRLLTTREVAHLLQVSERQVREIVAHGDLQAVVLPTYGEGMRKRLRFTHEDVEQFKDECKR